MEKLRKDEPSGVSLFQLVDFFGQGAIGLVNAVTVAAIHFGDFTELQDHFHHAAAVKDTAIAGNKFLNLHGATLP